MKWRHIRREWRDRGGMLGFVVSPLFAILYAAAGVALYFFLYRGGR